MPASYRRRQSESWSQQSRCPSLWSTVVSVPFSPFDISMLSATHQIHWIRPQLLVLHRPVYGHRKDVIISKYRILAQKNYRNNKIIRARAWFPSQRDCDSDKRRSGFDRGSVQVLDLSSGCSDSSNHAHDSTSLPIVGRPAGRTSESFRTKELGGFVCPPNLHSLAF